MNLKSALIKLYFLLVHADGEVNEREVQLGNQMAKLEGISETEFEVALEMLKKRTITNVYEEGIEELRKLDHQKQIRCVAWLCVVANADGFMDKTEWQFIYKVYHKELGLNLDEVMKTQKELIGLTMRKPVAMTAVL
jgi:uncharacterized tellurite resistance protein B-like protein